MFAIEIALPALTPTLTPTPIQDKKGELFRIITVEVNGKIRYLSLASRQALPNQSVGLIGER